MMSDLIVDLDNHLKHGHVYLVELETEWQDHPDEAPGSITVDVYVIASNWHLAQHIAASMYPDAINLYTHEDPITEYAYAARRNRGIL
jgi:hypothetical protein